MSTVLELTPTGSFRAEVAARLRQAIAVRNVKKSDIADAIEMNQASFSRRVNARLAINMDEADLICSVLGINRDWLLTGSGPMIDPDPSN
ncbi:helix-turn-helix domain-containing protein, partial [Mycolicibacterium llatzerense]|uniref:helix-turn-helix domain-containing protein n=1 Tax=Mycolicibacterium llatzerense TaxID=280871 RepID=UPI0021B6B37D